VCGVVVVGGVLLNVVKVVTAEDNCAVHFVRLDDSRQDATTDRDVPCHHRRENPSRTVSEPYMDESRVDYCRLQQSMQSIDADKPK
jgi:hypothetical protein